MNQRLRLPAYGKQLLNERRLGRHPLVVHVVYGETMHDGTSCELDCLGGFPPEKLPRPPASMRGNPHPLLWMKPSEFRPFKFDWHAVTGCAVCVFDLREDHLVGSRDYYELLGELGRFAGPVSTYRLEPAEKISGDVWAWRWEFYTAAHVMPLEYRKRGEEWPSHWPPETERENAKRRERWAAAWAEREQRESVAA